MTPTRSWIRDNRIAVVNETSWLIRTEPFGRTKALHICLARLVYEQILLAPEIPLRFLEIFRRSRMRGHLRAGRPSM